MSAHLSFKLLSKVRGALGYFRGDLEGRKEKMAKSLQRVKTEASAATSRPLEASSRKNRD